MPIESNPLYKDYSSHFAVGKTYDLDLHFSIYRGLYLHRLPKEKTLRILDLGCGKGQWLAWLKENGYTQLTGVDLSNDIHHGPEAAELVQLDIMEFLQTTSQQFDLIHAKDLIEHLDVKEALNCCRLIHERLNPGGVMWLMTFNAQAPLASSTRYSDLTHRMGLTPGSAAQLLNACGFEKVRCDGVHPSPGTLKGKLRKILYRPVAFVSRFIIILRHGARGSYSDCRPDLFIQGTRPASSLPDGNGK